MKILIRGAGFENKGAEAMLRTAHREIAKKFPEATFYADVSPLEAAVAYHNGIIPLLYEPSLRVEKLRKIPIISTLVNMLIRKKKPDFARADAISTKAAYKIKTLESVDAVIDVSGFAYSDDCAWGAYSVKMTWAWVDYCNSKDKPYILMPQAWGPFEEKQIAFLSKRICNGAAVFVSRDNQSSEFLARLQKKSINEIRQVPDIAFCFHGESVAAGESILKNIGIQNERPLIGIVPNMRVYERARGDSAANDYVKLLIEAANHCISNLGADVLLMPNEIKVPGNTSSDDRFLCSIIADQIQMPEHCHIIKDYKSSETVKSILGQVDLLIASRFHSLVFALSQGVPAVALGWSHKYIELLRPFGLENFVINHDQLDTTEVISLIETSWQQREDTIIKINKTLPDLKTQVQIFFDEVAVIIREANS